MSAGKTRLPIVGPGDALSGSAPAAFERLSKTCRVGDDHHRGLVRLCATIARHGLRRAVAPSARRSLEQGLLAAESWCEQDVGLSALRAARSLCFAATPSASRASIEALKASLGPAPAASEALLEHLDSVLWRYVGLSAKLAADAVLLTLDGVGEPMRLCEVVQQVAAARAYQAAALGAARSPELLKRARDQASFELEALALSAHQGDLLTLQVLHEYLGVRWKVLHDAERWYIDQFAEWALAGAPRR